MASKVDGGQVGGKLPGWLEEELGEQAVKALLASLDEVEPNPLAARPT